MLSSELIVWSSVVRCNSRNLTFAIVVTSFYLLDCISYDSCQSLIEEALRRMIPRIHLTTGILLYE